MTDLLELVPALERQLGVYGANSDLVPAQYSAYLADAVQALMFKWDREYQVEQVAENSYVVTPDIAQKDIRPIILMASIIFKMGNVTMASFQDGDFSYNPFKGAANTLEIDRSELIGYLGKIRLAKPSTGPLRGFAAVWSTESYMSLLVGGWIEYGLY